MYPWLRDVAKASSRLSAYADQTFGFLDVRLTQTGLALGMI